MVSFRQIACLILQYRQPHLGRLQQLRSQTQLLSHSPFSQLSSTAYATKGRISKGSSSATEVQDYDAKDTERRMQKALDHMLESFRSMRTGRLSEGILDNLKVDAYDELMPLRNIAAVSVRDGQTLAVSPFDIDVQKAIEKAIRSSSLGLNPSLSGQEILVPVPKPSRESLNAVVKMLKDEGEAAKLSVRQARKVAMDILKTFNDESSKRRLEKQVQAMTDSFNKKIEQSCASKQKEISSST